MDAQLKKGILDMCILYYVSQNEMYGYDIMQYMHQYFPEVNESTFYAILRRLNKEKCTDTYLGTESNGPPRKYYRITDQGKIRLQANIQDWNNICNIVNTIGVK
jgi:PadR family transcriptional regulator PadR